MTWPAGELDPEADPLYRRIREAPAGLQLGGVLERIDQTRVPQATLLEMIAASERQRHWAETQQVTYFAELERRALLGRTSSREVAAEVASRLLLAQPTASARVDEAFELVRLHPEVWRAVESAGLSMSRARAITQQTTLLDEQIPQAKIDLLEREAAAKGTTMTPGRLRAFVKRRIERLIPDTVAEQRHEAAREQRDVWLRPEADGMASLGALLPAADAQAAFLVIDRMASVKDADDDRTRAQRRADAFGSTFRTMLDAGQGPEGALPTAQRHHPHLLITVGAFAGQPSSGAVASLGSSEASATPPIADAAGQSNGEAAATSRTDAAALVGALVDGTLESAGTRPCCESAVGVSGAGGVQLQARGEAPIDIAIGQVPRAADGRRARRAARGSFVTRPSPHLELSGYGPITLTAARRALPSGIVAYLRLDPRTGERHHLEPANNLTTTAVLDAIELAGLPPPAPPDGATPARAAPSQVSATRDRPGHAEPGQTELGQAVPSHAEPSQTVPGHVVPSHAEPAPAEPASGNARNVGPPPPNSTLGRIQAKAERLAAAWHGQHWSDTYRPLVDLLRHVLLRDSTCTFPSCRVPAWRSEVDHIEEFDTSRPAREQTTAPNLHTACKGHHQLKTLFGWRVARNLETGAITWTSPTGFARTSRPEYLD